MSAPAPLVTPKKRHQHDCKQPQTVQPKGDGGKLRGENIRSRDVEGQCDPFQGADAEVSEERAPRGDGLVGRMDLHADILMRKRNGPDFGLGRPEIIDPEKRGAEERGREAGERG